MIEKIDQTRLDKIRAKTPESLPINPSTSGMSPQAVRRHFYAGMTDEKESVVAELNRIVDEVNEEIETINGNADGLDTRLETAESEIDTLQTDMAGAEADITLLGANIQNLGDTVGAIQEKDSEQDNRLTLSESDIAHIEAIISNLELGIVPREIHNAGDMLESINPSLDYRENDNPDNPTLSERLTSWIVTNLGRQPNETDALMVKDIAEPNKDYVHTYYYWEALGTHEAGWRLANIGHAPPPIEQQRIEFTEASTRANIATGESTATLFGKIKKYFTDLKTHAFNDLATTLGEETDKAPTNKLLYDTAALKANTTDLKPHAFNDLATTLGTETDKAPTNKLLNDTAALKANTTDLKPHAFTTPSATQSTSADTVPSSKLLKESSFARVYRSRTELDLDVTFTPEQLFEAMAGNSMAILDVGVENTGLSLPFPGYGLLIATRAYSAARCSAEFIAKVPNSTALYRYSGTYRTSDAQNKWSGWKKLIDDSTAQTISGVKTYTASPIVPTTPSGPSAAVAKSYVDGVLSNPTMVVNGDFTRNDSGIASFTSPVAESINKWGFGITGSGTGETGSYTAATKTLKSDMFETGGHFVFLYQYIDNPTRLNGKTVTLSIKAKSTTGYFLGQLWEVRGGVLNSTVATAINRTLFKSVSFTFPEGYFSAGDTLRVVFQTYGETVLDYAKLEIGSLATAYTPEQNFVDTDSRQTITGIKTFATGATPLITDAPTTDLMAVNKAYVDGRVSENNISYFTTKEQVKEVVPNWVYKQSGSTLAWNFNTLLNNIRLAGHPRSVVCIYFDGVNAYLGNNTYKNKECYLTAFITEEPLNRRVEIFVPKTANTLARKDLYIGNDNDVYHDFVYQESIFVPELYYTRGDIGITTLPSGVYELRLDAKDSSDSYYFTIEVHSNTTTFGSQSGVGLFGPKINCRSFKGKIDFYLDNGASPEEYKAYGYFHYRKIKDLYGSNQIGKIANWIPVT